jgi:uncharacterized protein YbjT (DUF2867 family)
MRVFVTGATGYVGSRLIPVLLDEGCEVHAATRSPEGVTTFAWADDVTPVTFDIEDETSIVEALEGMDAVVYLVHSMGEGDFVRKDREAAEQVAAAAEKHGVGRIVYLSGLIPDDDLSDHLRSRLEVEQVLLHGSVPATVLRAAMVIGSGSTSFELLRRLTERVPVTPIPRWMCRTLQPIAVQDVVHLLAGALRGAPRNRHYDVGGDERVDYPELLALFARTAGLRRPQVVLPLVPKRLVGRLVALIAGMPAGTVEPLVDSLSHDMVCAEDDAKRDLADEGHRFLSLEEALTRSLNPDEQGTSPGADLQAPADTDPDWAGGVVSVEGGRVVQRPRTRIGSLLLGARSQRAVRRRR